MLKVLVTRPKLFAASLCEKIEAWGGVPLLFPTIEIFPIRGPGRLHQEMKALRECDMAIFTSRPAAIYGMSVIAEHFSSLPKILFAALGPGTAKELKQAGAPSVLCPNEPPYESESLLRLPALHNIQRKKVLLFRGNEGRPLLYNTLQARGAYITIAEVYRRALPKPVGIPVPDIVIVTSPECLTNLKVLVGPKLWRILQQCPFITVGWRTYNLSATLGIRNRYLASGAEDSYLLQTLTQIVNNLQNTT